MKKNAILDLVHAAGNWWWRLKVKPKVSIRGDKWDYKSKATAARAAVKVADALDLRIKHTFINGVKQK